MAEDFKTELDGTLHVLFHFMKRTGYQVLYQENVAILPGGEVTTDLKTAPEKSYVGNRYYIRKNGQNKTKTVYYFAVNIMNTPYASRVGLVENGLETRTELVEFLKKRNIASTYLKSASYLLHKPDFSIMRDLILTESEAVLQDDSGIPVKYFDPQSFDIQLFGTYTQPIPLFAGSFQSDLKALYDSSKTVRELPFGIGYQFQTGTSNLMLATKRP